MSLERDIERTLLVVRLALVAILPPAVAATLLRAGCPRPWSSAPTSRSSPL